MEVHPFVGLGMYLIAIFFALMIGAVIGNPKRSAIVFVSLSFIFCTLIYIYTKMVYGDLIYIAFLATTAIIASLNLKRRDIFAFAEFGKYQTPVIPATHPVVHEMIKQLSIPQKFRLVGPFTYVSDDGDLILYVHPDDPENPSKFTLSVHKFFWIFNVSPTPKDIPVPVLSSNARIIVQHYSGAMLLRYIDNKLEELNKELREVEEIKISVTREKNEHTYVSARIRELQLKSEIKKLEELRKKLSEGVVRVILIDVWAGPIELKRFDYYTLENHIRHLVATVQAAEDQLKSIAYQQGYITIKAVSKGLDEILTFQAGVDVIPKVIEDYLDKAIIKEEITDMSRQLWEKLAEILKSSSLGVTHIDLRYAIKTPKTILENPERFVTNGVVPVAFCVDPKTGKLLGPEYTIWFDYSDTQKARHTLIAGGTGTGKSFAAKTIVTWLATFNPDIRFFIFDDGTYSGLALPGNPELFERYGIPRDIVRGFNAKLWIVGENLLLNILRRPNIQQKELLQAEAGMLVKRLLNIIGSKSKTLQAALYNAIMYYWERGEDADLDKIVNWIHENVRGRSLTTIINELNSLYAYRILMHPEGITDFEQLFESGNQIAIFRAEGVSEEVRALIAEILIEWSREWLKSKGPSKKPRLFLVIDEAFANFKMIMRKLEKWIVEARKFGGVGIFISQRIIGHFPPGVRQQALGYVVVFKGVEKELGLFGVDKEVQELLNAGAKYHIALVMSPVGLLPDKALVKFIPPLASHEKAPDRIEEKLLGMIFKKEAPKEIIYVEKPAVGWRAVFGNEERLIWAIDQIAQGVGFRKLAKELGLDSPWKVRRWHEAIKLLLRKGYPPAEIAQFLINNDEIKVTKFLEFANNVPPKNEVDATLDELFNIREPLRV